MQFDKTQITPDKLLELLDAVTREFPHSTEENKDNCVTCTLMEHFAKSDKLALLLTKALAKAILFGDTSMLQAYIAATFLSGYIHRDNLQPTATPPPESAFAEAAEINSTEEVIKSA